MKYLFFHIYNRFYQDGKLNVNNQPVLKALGLISLGTYFWFQVLYEIYYYCILKIHLPSK